MGILDGLLENVLGIGAQRARAMLEKMNAG